MELVFDSEEEKKEILDILIQDYCPRDMGLKNLFTPIECTILKCKECWETAIRMGVKGE